MVLFTIFASMAIVAAIIAIVLVGTIGGATLVVFGDVIVFALIMWAIIKLLFRKKK